MTVKVTRGAGVSLALGAVWRLTFRALDNEQVATPTVTVTPPGGLPDVVLTVDDCGFNWWSASYVTAHAGVHTALVDTVGYGVAAAAAFVVGDLGPAAWQTTDDLDDYLGEHSATAQEMEDTLSAETAAQFAACRIPGAYPPNLRMALLRRCARALAMKGIPLAVLQGDDESGSTVLPGSDPEVRRLEKPYRRMKVG